MPVPVPVPAYYERPHHHHHHDEDFDGYDYTHPHLQYRKDMEELKEWGIEPYEETTYEESSQHLNRVVPGPVAGPASAQYGLSQYAPNAKPVASSYLAADSVAAGAHNLAYSGYLNDIKYNRRPGAAQQPLPPPANPSLVSSGGQIAPLTNTKNSYSPLFASNTRPLHHTQPQRLLAPIAAAKSSSVAVAPYETDDEYYGPIIGRLEDIFAQLRFHEGPCRERLVCSMYKNPAVYSPHSNLVSNELSR